MKSFLITRSFILFLIITSLIACNYPQYLKLSDKAIDLIKVQDYRGAIQYLNQSINMNNTFYDAYINRSYCYSYLDNYSNAIADLDTSIMLHRKNPMAYDNRGLFKEAIGDTLGALFDFRNAINIKSNRYIYYTHYGRLLALKGHYKDALFYLNKAIEKKAFNDCFTEYELTQLIVKCEQAVKLSMDQK